MGWFKNWKEKRKNKENMLSTKEDFYLVKLKHHHD
jgi:hypothetical protein